MPNENKLVVLDLTKAPADWGTDETSVLGRQGWESEPPSCYCCGLTAHYDGLSELAIRSDEYGDPELFHYDCYCLNRLKYVQAYAALETRDAANKAK